MKISLKRYFVFTALLALVLVPPAFAGKIYKWIDKDGNVQYGAQKPTENAREMKIKVKHPTEAATSEPETGSAETGKNKDSKEEKVKVSSEKEAAEIEKKNAEIRKKNCSTAKKRLASINAGGRLYEVNEKGERSYWDDATRASKLAEAQAMVDEWCK